MSDAHALEYAAEAIQQARQCRQITAAALHQVKGTLELVLPRLAAQSSQRPRIQAEIADFTRAIGLLTSQPDTDSPRASGDPPGDASGVANGPDVVRTNGQGNGGVCPGQPPIRSSR